MLKKIFRSSLIILVLISMLTMPAYGYDLETSARVRIREPRKYNEQVRLVGDNDISMYDHSIDINMPIATLGNDLDVLLDGYYDTEFLWQSEEDENTMVGYYHVSLASYVFSDYESALAEAHNLSDNYGTNFYPFYNNGSFSIYGGSFVSEQDCQDLADSLLQNSIDASVVNGLNKSVLFYDENNNIVLMYDDNFNLYFSYYNEHLDSNAIYIDGRLYRGKMAFSVMPDRLISINIVPLQQYLYGVVPNEIFISWPMETIKAQAVAARTYAVANINPDSWTGYDLEDNQNSQVYRGYESEVEVTSQAVDETDGIMIYHDDELITAFFHSTSGGRTENSENVWVATVPYLKAVDDPYSNISPYTEWEVAVSDEELLLSAQDENPDVSAVYGVTLTEISENYRVMECVISTDVGDIVLGKESVRAIIGYDVLPSSWFTVSTDTDVYLLSENSFKYVPKIEETVSDEDEIDNDESNEEEDKDDSLVGESENLEEDDSLVGEGEDSDLEEDESSLLDDESSLLDEEDTDSDLTDSDEELEEIIENPDEKRVAVSSKYIISASGTDRIENSELSVISEDGVEELPSIPVEYYFIGRGFGHGIGLSQYGAKAMADEGFNFEEILKYYYTGVEVR